jgi:hypothetical protein
MKTKNKNGKIPGERVRGEAPNERTEQKDKTKTNKVIR